MAPEYYTSFLSMSRAPLRLLRDSKNVAWDYFDGIGREAKGEGPAVLCILDKAI